MPLFFTDKLDIEVNVVCILRDRSGKIVQEHRSHNVVVNIGRRFARNILGCGTYPVGPTQPAIPKQSLKEYALKTGDDEEDEIGNYKMRYIGVGVGGALQSQPYPGQGSYTELVTVRGLEKPVLVGYKVDGYVFGDATLMTAKGYDINNPPTRLWLAQVMPQVLDDPAFFPDNFKIRFKRLFGYDEISNVNQIGEYGTQVPISEVGLFTSEADPYKAPVDAANYLVKNKLGGTMETIVGQNGDVPGFFAYNITVPMIKTPLVTLEVIWEIRT